MNDETPKGKSDVIVPTSELTNCPKCGARALEQTTPLIMFTCMSSIAPYANDRFETGVQCHAPTGDSLEALFDEHRDRWSSKKPKRIQQEIESWEKHFERHGQAYAFGAGRTPPGVLPDGDKVSALKEALKIAEAREQI